MNVVFVFDRVSLLETVTVTDLSWMQWGYVEEVVWRMKTKMKYVTMLTPA
jgi:hypothetical protein